MKQDVINIPLFPLHAVLYPGGRLRLRIFEQRYLDMAKACFKEESSFGICLIRHGKEVGQPAIPEKTGTLARIADWDMPQLGVLNIAAVGEQRFRIVDHHTARSGLLLANVEVIPDEPVQTVTDEFESLAQVLQTLIAKMGHEAPPQPHRFSDAAWLGFRLGEVLPFDHAEKQHLLEIDESLNRLEAVRRFLQHHNLLPD